MYRATCPECGDALKLGKSIRCSLCRKTFKVSTARLKDEAQPWRERPTVSKPVGMFVAAVAAALFFGFAAAGGAAAPRKLQDPILPRPDGGPKPPVPPRDAKIEANNLVDSENGLALPNIGGWLLLDDGVTLIVALPEQTALAHIDTTAGKELKRVALPFKPDRLAVQGKRLFASVQGASAVHVLDLDSGADKKQINVPGGFVVDKVCHRQKGLVFASTSNQDRIVALDPDAGTAALTGELMGPLPGVGTGRFLAIDPKNANTLYVSYLNAGDKWHRGEHETWSYLGLKKFTVMSKMEVNPENWKQIGNSSILPAGRFWPLQVIQINPWVRQGGAFYPMSFSSDGKSVGVTDGHKWDLLSTADLKTRSGTIACSGAADLAFHPVLDLITVEGENVVSGQNRGTALYLFNSKLLTQMAKVTFGGGPFHSTPASGRLLTFGARGTKLLYYDWLRGGYLRFLPLTLPHKDLEALAKAFGVEVRPFQVPGAIEGEHLKIIAKSGAFPLNPQDMTPFLVGQWSGDRQLFGQPPSAGAWADLELPALVDGKYHVVVSLTKSWDYGIIQFQMNGAKLGKPIDGFHADTAVSTGAIDLGEAELKKGANTLRVEVIGSNPDSRPPHYSWGLDCVVLTRTP
jgi:hypothetical protein